MAQVDAWALNAITAYLGTKGGEYKPKKLGKKLVKKGIAEPHEFEAWVRYLKAGDIPGYTLDAGRELIVRNAGILPPTKRKNKRKAERPESTVEVQPNAASAEVPIVYPLAREASKYASLQAPVSPSETAQVVKPLMRQPVDAVTQGAHQNGNNGKAGAPTAKKRKPGLPSKHALAEEPNEGTWRASVKRADIKTGQWSGEEQRQLRLAIRKYAENHDLDPDNLDWMIGKKHSQTDGRGMWTEISNDLPQRSIKAVAAAALRLFHPYAGKGAFSPDEDNALRGLVRAHGNKWTEFSPVLKRTPEACRLRWRDIKDQDRQHTGKWSEEEERQLIQAVEKYGNASRLKGDGTDKRVLLDNIDWEAVMPHVPTRNRTQCVAKWYLRLAPSMSERGVWGDGDDKKLMKALFKLRENEVPGRGWQEATVPWSKLLEGRTGDECKRRWAFLKKNVADAKNKEFMQMVHELVSTYYPAFLGVRRPHM